MKFGERSTARSLLAKAGLGRLAYLAWHAPRAWAARSRRAGGPWQQWLDRQGQNAMRKTADTLPPLPRPLPSSPEICFLTGRRFWYQTAFCAWSLQRAAGTPLKFVVHDDGSFTSTLSAEIRRLLPGCTIVSAAEIETRLDTHLPAGRFPALRSQRRSYIHLRKLTDFHAGHAGMARTIVRSICGNV